MGGLREERHSTHRYAGLATIRELAFEKAHSSCFQIIDSTD